MLRNLALLAGLVLCSTAALALPPNPNTVQCAGYGPCAYKHIATNATTQVKTGAGFLHAITINTKGASANVVSVFDNSACSGTTIAVIDDTASLGTLVYDVAFATGLCVLTATGTAGDLTVLSR